MYTLVVIEERAHVCVCVFFYCLLHRLRLFLVFSALSVSIVHIVYDDIVGRCAMHDGVPWYRFYVFGSAMHVRTIYYIRAIVTAVVRSTCYTLVSYTNQIIIIKCVRSSRHYSFGISKTNERTDSTEEKK